MHGTDRRSLARHYLEQGMGKAEVARRLGVARRTVYNWIESGALDSGRGAEYGPRPRRPSKLDPYKGIIEARLASYPRLSSKRLFEEVRAAGYPGGYDQVKRHVRAVRPVDAAEPVQRFETPPGRQGQVDFAEFRLPWGRRWALIVVLGYSRLMWLRFYERQTMMVVVRGLEESFSYFGGVPEELLFDQMKTVVASDRRDVGGSLVRNSEFEGFSEHWGFTIRACRPYRAQTKGKVERPVRYVRDNFFYGREFASDGDLNARARQWLDGTANVRVHGTLKERIGARFDRERSLLRPLAPTPYVPVVPRPEPEEAPGPKPAAAVPSVEVERRDLGVYAAVAGGGR